MTTRLGLYRELHESGIILPGLSVGGFHVAFDGNPVPAEALLSLDTLFCADALPRA